MEKVIVIKKGLDLDIDGAPEGKPSESIMPQKAAIVPDDFQGITPKLDVHPGDHVMCGSPIFHDKSNPEIKITSPIAGKIANVVRGERRKILEITIDASENPTESVKIMSDPSSAESIRSALLESGLWAQMRQRPYDIVPDPAKAPRDIFITAFDSAPLAPDLTLAIGNRVDDINSGIAALKLLTHGNVYVGVRNGFPIPIPDNAIKVTVKGPHPSGNPGIQCANIKPVNKGETVWTLDVVTLCRIGRLIRTSTVDTSTVVAITGSEIRNPKYVSTICGAEIAPLIAGNVKSDSRHLRIISGNVLTGVTVSNNSYLRFPYRQITVIPEGDDINEFMGWASLSPSKMSVNRSFPSRLLGRHSFRPDARILGGRRAMIMSGEYDKVLPMDILPEYLIKAIMARDIDKMEQLGIYEVAPEDFALCEFVDPSKIEIQKIVREGLDYLRKELE